MRRPVHATCSVMEILGRVPIVLLGVLLAVGLGLMVLFADGMEYACKQVFSIPNGALLLIAAVCAVGLLCLVAGGCGRSFARLLNRCGSRVDLCVLVATIVLLLVQVRLCRAYAFATGWDSGIITHTAWVLSRGEPVDASYFSTYPNNVFLLWIATWCMRVSSALGNATIEGGIQVFATLNCIACAVALLATYHTLRMMWSRGWALAGWVLCVAVAWTSPWAGILYSDAIVLFVPVCQVMLYAAARRTSGFARCFCCFLLGCIAILGYRIKPQAVLPFMAIVAWELLRAVARFVQRRAEGSDALGDHADVGVRRFVPAISLVFGAILMLSLTSAAVSSLGIRLDEEQSFSPAHYLMMGLNPETRGIYLEEDVGYSRSFPDKASRIEGDVAVIKQRVAEYGADGLLGLFADKLMTNLNDGTFAWGVEGHFFDVASLDAGGFLAPRIRSLYYPDGALWNAWRTYAQGVWVAVLAGCVCALIARGLARRTDSRAIDNGGNDEIGLLPVLALSLLMLMVFELLFEARARYLYSSVPLFVVLAVTGVRSACYRVCGAKRW